MALGRSFPFRTIPAADKIAESQSSWYHVFMNEFTIIKPEELSANAFSTIGKDWLLITAEVEGKVNTMTASWGGLGVMWHKNAAFIFIRPQRYTYEFAEREERLSLSFFDGERREALAFCGKASGRDCDKIAEAGLSTEFYGNTPYIAEAKYVLICHKIYVDDIREDKFLTSELLRHYPIKDYHRVYVCEIETVLENV